MSTKSSISEKTSLHLNLKKAKKINEEHTAMISSKRDSELFFHTILHPEKPNAKLVEAAEKYKKENINGI